MKGFHLNLFSTGNVPAQARMHISRGSKWS